ncbi:fasciclin domain-containing protein [Pontibacter cellulosilyticus]|uniref:Fasciclin domain-containing protein n=1 Tax=Pontibacter cellulosilyticus TaxID=1720253 RepID=A0A923N6Q4_9BACT|nr:fasciclin domain-containing protein [Pontibacter cellulosilyticus]MBC5993228.1 fasciclin domain-containing protein [Pontibacter cellulosilyticus]
MKKMKIHALVSAIMCSAILMGCGGADDSRNENPMQEERSRPNLGAETEAKRTEPNTPGKQAGEGGGIANPEIGGKEVLPSQTIVENIYVAPRLSNLESAIKQAELVRTLNATGPYTILAPDDAAFDALPEGVLEDLMKNENKQDLIAILNNHVIAGKLTSQNLQDGTMLKTVGGEQLTVTKRNNKIMVNGAEVIEMDGESKNGTIHVINKVLVPSKKE